MAPSIARQIDGLARLSAACLHFKPPYSRPIPFDVRRLLRTIEPSTIVVPGSLQSRFAPDPDGFRGCPCAAIP
jgi:hypothetical protein